MSKVNFTIQRVSSFKCSAETEQDYLWDTGAPGLGLRATRNGSKSYVFQAKINKKTARITIGDPATWSIPQAQSEARRLKLLVDAGKDPRVIKAEELAAVEAEQKRMDAITVMKTLLARTAWDAYLAAPHISWGEQHRADHRYAAQEGGQECKIGNRKSKAGPLASILAMPLNAITAAVVREWLAKESAVRPTFALNAYRKFRTFIRWCSNQPEYADIVHKDCCVTDAVQEMVPDSKAKEGDCLQREQLALWFGAIRQLNNPVMSAYLQALLLTGARRNELTALKWAEVDFKWRTMVLGDKVEESRTIPLTDYLAALLYALPRVNEWVFHSLESESGHLESPTKAHAHALKTAGLPHVSLHGLRRSFGTLAEWVEVPTGISAQIMGHKPSALAEKHYRRRPLDLLRKWHNQIEAWILEQADIEVAPSEPRLRLAAA
jgi:integrase